RGAIGLLVLRSFLYVRLYAGYPDYSFVAVQAAIAYADTSSRPLRGGTGPPFRSCRYAFYERNMMKKYIPAMAACLAAVATPVLATDFKIEEATIPEIEQAFRDHRLTCHQLVQTYFDRIAAYDKQGPKLNAILTLNGSALAAADLLDTSFAHGGKLGALHRAPCC